MNTPNWVNRNWKLLIVLIAIESFAILTIGALLFSYFTNTSDVLRGAMLRICTNKDEIESLGSPINISGDVKLTKSFRRIGLIIPVTGPKGSAKVYAAADKSISWSFGQVMMQTDQSHLTIEISEY